MTIVELKNMLRIQHNHLDQYLAEMLQLMIDYVEEECNRSFHDDKGEYHLPSGVRLFIIKGIEYNLNQAGVTSETLAESTVSYSLDFPESIKRGLRQHRRVKFV